MVWLCLTLYEILNLDEASFIELRNKLNEAYELRQM